jgi:hypothetical protein
MATEHDTSTSEPSTDTRGASLDALAKVFESAADRIGEDLRGFYSGEPATHPDPIVGCRIVKAWGIVGTLERAADGLRVGSAAPSLSPGQPQGMAEAQEAAATPARYSSELVPAASLLHQRVAQARALSLLMTGEGFEHFTQFPPDVQHDALAALDSLLDDANTAAERVRSDCVGPRNYAGVPGGRRNDYQ